MLGGFLVVPLLHLLPTPFDLMPMMLCGGKFWLEIWLEIHKGQVLQAGSKPFKAESHSKPGGV